MKSAAPEVDRWLERIGFGRSSAMSGRIKQRVAPANTLHGLRQ